MMRAACVIGWPVEHSRSPLLHNYWLKLYRIPGAYRHEAVPPDQFRDFIGSLAARGYAGANVTVPHKEAALQCSQPDERARAVVLRVNSPGGSSTASDSIWREVVRARAGGKPVVVSMGDVAASGAEAATSACTPAALFATAASERCCATSG